MGTIRFLLAVSVMLSHSYAPIFLDGKLAVQLFYLISGFLISYILIDLKSYSSTYLFFKNRFLRLFPLYYLVVIFSLIAFLLSEIFRNGWIFNNFFWEADTFIKIFTIVANTIIIGQDLVFFLILDNNLDRTIEGSIQEFPLQNSLIIPPSWTLALELYFYLLAPLILRNRAILITTFLLSLLLKLILVLDGSGLERPYNYQFFPAELSIFLLGAISNQYWKPLVINFIESIKLVNTILLSSIFICLMGQWILIGPFMDYLIILIFSLFLPFLFAFQNKWVFDKKIGDLSYPIYIWHWIVIILVSFILPKFGIIDEFLRVLLITISTIGIAYISNQLIGNRIEAIRAKNKSRT